MYLCTLISVRLSVCQSVMSIFPTKAENAPWRTCFIFTFRNAMLYRTNMREYVLQEYDSYTYTNSNKCLQVSKHRKGIRNRIETFSLRRQASTLSSLEYGSILFYFRYFRNEKRGKEEINL